jgi:hypothetical protein
MATLPSAASAVDRYAAPDGDGANPCAVSDPCALEPAVEGASDGDQVILVGGAPPNPPFVQTSAANPIVVPAGADVRGATGAHQVVNFAPAVGANTGFLLGDTSTLTDFDILYEGSGAAVIFSTSGGNMERVFVRSVGANANGPCFITGPTTIRDSICWYDTDSIQGAGVELFLQTGDVSVNLVNSTIVSSSVEPGLYAYTVGGAATVNVTNSIVRSDTGPDVRGQVLAGTEDIDVVLDHSNYATESDSDGAGTQIGITDPGTPTNQMAPPVFVDAPGGDFRQTASSAGTLDLGTATALLPGELDLDGLARSVGAAPDIGAHELPATAPPPPGGGPITPGTTVTPTTPPPATKTCKKGQKLKKGKCVKKKRKKK